jgi:SNF2 family DNA or RNA helicase
MHTVRLDRIEAPKEHLKEILGDLKHGQMHDCIYNSIVAGEYADWKAPRVDLARLLPGYPKVADITLKDYQIEDLQKSLGLSQVFNINKPGYGKTLETILWIKLILQKNFKALILCPKSVISSWTDQLDHFWPNWYKDGTWWITNYEQLYDEVRFNVAKSFEWDIIVLDESHTIKSMKSKITEIVFNLHSTYRQCLTGTPIKNRPEDLAAQLKWLDPTSITNYTDFQLAFCNLVADFRDHGIKHVIPRGLTQDPKMVENLQKLLDLYCIGGKEHNIGLIDQPNRIKVRLDLDDKVKALYKKIEAETIDTEGLLEAGIKVSNPIEAATRRQQLASNPQLFDFKLRNVKFEWISDWLAGTDEKVIIFSKYAQTIQTLERYLRLKGFSVVSIKREQSANLRQLMKEQWQRSSQVLLGTYGVLSAGIDGLQDVCHYEIFVDREWTASDNEQAEGRIVRTGQKYQPIIYILQAKGTIDLRVEQVQLDKGDDAHRLLDPITDK